MLLAFLGGWVCGVLTVMVAIYREIKKLTWQLR